MAADEVGNLKVTTEVDTSGIEDGMDKAEKVAAKGGEAAGEALSENLGDGLDKAEKAAQDSGEAAGTGFSEKFSVGLAGVTTALGALLVSVGAASIDIASQSNESLRSIQTQLGLTEENATQLRDAALDVYKNGFGESLEETTAALIEVRKQVKGLSDEELSGLTENAFKLKDVFGVEVNESMNTVNTLMEQFGLTSEEATDFLTLGFQRGLDNSGDFLDTIGEYGPQFAASGFSAEEFFSTLETGQAGGVLGTDKIADSFKEFRLIVTEGSDDTAAAFNDLGINADDLYAGMQDGSLTTSDAFQMVQKSLSGISDPIERNRLGVALFGTMWEDATEGVILGVDTTKTSLDELAGATDGLAVKYDSFGSIATAAWRTFQTEALLPIGEKLLALANTILPYVRDGIASIGQLLSGDVSLSQFIQNIGGWIAGVIPTIETGLSLLLSTMTSWVADNVPVWIDSLGQLAEATITWITDALPKAVAALAELWQAMVGWIMDSAPPWAAALLDFTTALTMWVLDALPPLIKNLGSVVTSMVSWVVDSLPGWGAELAKLGEKLWQWVVDMLPTLGQKLGEVLTTLISWVGSTIVELAPKLLDLAWSFISWIVTDVLPALPGALWDIAGAILGFITSLIGELAAPLLELAGSFLSWITDSVLPAIGGKLGEVWNAISGWISETITNVLEAAKGIGQALVDGISATVEAGATLITGVVKAILNPIIGFINDVIDGANSVATALGFDPIDAIPQLADGVQNWGGGLAMVSEPWKGIEWADIPGIGQGLMMPGVYDLPQGTEVLDAATTASMMQPNAGSQPAINQYFDAGVTESGVMAAAYAAVEQALDAVGQRAYIRQQIQ